MNKVNKIEQKKMKRALEKYSVGVGETKKFYLLMQELDSYIKKKVQK